MTAVLLHRKRNRIGGYKNECDSYNFRPCHRSSEVYEDYKIQLVDYITDKAVEGIDKTDLGSVIATHGAGAVKSMDLGALIGFVIGLLNILL